MTTVRVRAPAGTTIRAAREERPRAGIALPAWWLVPGLGLLLAAVVVQVMLIRVYPDWSWRLIDVAVYQGAGEALRDGASLYAGSFGHVPSPFTYPPFAAAVLLPLSFLSLDAAGAVLLAAAAGAVAATVWLVLGARGYAPGAGRLGATAGLTAVVMATQPFHSEVQFGQINAVLMLLVVADLTLPDRFRFKGLGIGLAAGIKLLPGIFVLYLLVTRRWRAAAVAAAAFAGTVLVGALVAPQSSVRYWSGTFADAGRVGVEAGPSAPLNQSIYAVVVRTLGAGLGATAVWAVLAAAALTAGLALAGYAFRRGDDLVGVFVAGLTGLFVSPISWTTHWVWLTVGLVLAVDAVRRLAGRAQIAAAAVPTFLVLALLAWPMASGQASGVLHLKPLGFIRHVPQDGAEFHWSPGQWMQGNLYLLVGVGLVVAVVLWLRTAQRDPLPQPSHP